MSAALTKAIEVDAAALIACTSKSALIDKVSNLKKEPQAIAILTRSYQLEVAGGNAPDMLKLLISGMVSAAKAQGIELLTCPGCETPNFGPAGLKAHRCKGIKRDLPVAASKAKPKAIDGKAALVVADDLPSLAAGIDFTQREIDEIGRRAMQQALPLKLAQGLYCLKAQALYLAKEGAKGGRPKNRSESDQLSEEALEEPASFNEWVATQPLTKGSAYDYMRAVEGLGLDHKADEKQLAKAYEAARRKADGDLSITKLKNLLEKPEEPEEPAADPNTPEAKAAEAREQAAAWITHWDRSVKAGNLEHADVETLKQLDEFLTHTRDHIRKRLKSSKA